MWHIQKNTAVTSTSSRRQHVDGDLLAHLEAAGVLEAELDQPDAGLDLGLAEVTGLGLVEAAVLDRSYVTCTALCSRPRSAVLTCTTRMARP